LHVNYVAARTLVHSTAPKITSWERPHHVAEPAVHRIPRAKDVSSKVHINAQLVDVTQRVLELPEQTLSTAVSHNAADLEEEDNADPVQRVQEIPEQTLDAAPLMDLEETNRLVRRQTAPTSVEVKSHEVFDDDNSETFNGVTTKLPDTKEKITWSGIFPPHSLADGVPAGTTKALLKNRDRRPREVARADGKMAYDSRQSQDEAIQLTSGGMQISIHNAHAKNFLDASRVQVGTSRLGAYDEGEGRVARFRVKFIAPFEKRPIVLITTVPDGGDKKVVQAPYPDVFVASVSEVRVDHFVVNVIRMDEFPHNGWGQDLFLDGIAMEYDSDYPTSTPGGKVFLPTHPDFPDFEKRVDTSVTSGKLKETNVPEEASDWDN